MRERVGAVGSRTDGRPACGAVGRALPAVGKGAEAIGISNGGVGSKSLVLGWCARERKRARGRIVASNNHQLGIGRQRSCRTWSSESENCVVTRWIADSPTIEFECSTGELIEVSGSISRLNGVGEGEDPATTTTAVDGIAINGAGF